MRRWLGIGSELKTGYSWSEKIGGLIDITRPRLCLMTPLGSGAAAVLAGGRFPPIAQCFWGFGAVALAVAGIHTFNDYVDRKRDRTVWPGRPIPSGRVGAFEALLLTVACFFTSAVITWFVFNEICFAILALTMLLGTLYSLNLRRKVGYLTLPPINGLIYLGGWTAVSPATLFTSWLPWGLFLLAILWQTGHIMIYSAVHPSTREGDKILTESQAFLYKPNLEEAAKMGFAFLSLTFFFSVLLGFIIHLGVIYLVLIVSGGTLALRHSLRFLKDVGNREKGFKAFGAASNFMLIIRGAILIAVFIRYV